MESSSKHTQRRPVPDAVAKLVPLRSRTDSEKSEPTSTRARIRNALPGTAHNQQQSRNQKQPHSHRQAVKDSVQSALELRPPINFDHLLRRDKRPTPSRRHSGNDSVRADVVLSDLQQTTRALKEHVDTEDVNKFRHENDQREEELRSALQQVEEQSMLSTRELDTTYYVLLEKAETLRSVISNMQRLAQESRQFREGFTEQSRALQTETGETIDGYTNFDQQEASIKALLSRLETYKDRTSTLNQRLDKARRRAEVCERHILHAQAQRRKRWSITWAVMFAAVVAFLAILLFRSSSSTVLPLTTTTQSEQEQLDYVSPFLATLKAGSKDNDLLTDLFRGIT